jgi:uncharacterized membrane protein YhhN
MAKRYIPLLFALLLIAHCVFIYLDITGMRVLSKVLLIPVLLIYLAPYGQKNEGSLLWAYFALLFSFLGDVLLTHTGELFFLLGMLAFIGTHISNTVFFLKLVKQKIQAGKGVIAAISLLALFSAFVFYEIKDGLGSFKVPILIYMFLISVATLAATATLQAGLYKKAGLYCFVPGTVLFVLSDSLLALNKFKWHQPMADIFVMLTYAAAQYLLVRGYIMVNRDNKGKAYISSVMS